MARDHFRRITFAGLISEGALEIGDGYRAKNEELGGDGLMFLRAGHVTDTHIDFVGVERFHAALEPRLRGKVAKPGDAVVTTKGNSTGRTTFVTDSMPPFVYSPHLSYWRSLDSSRVEGGFLRYWSKGPEFTSQLTGMKASTDMAPYLSLIDQKQLGVTLPPICEQRAIAHILGTLDDKIELNRRISATLDEIARALFKSWFVDFDPVRAKAEGRPTSLPPEIDALFPDSLEESSLGDIPLGWVVGKLDDVLAELVSGARPKGGAASEGVPSIGAENVQGLGYHDFSKEKFVPRVFFEQLKRKGAAIKCGDVLLYKDGASIGRKTYVDCGFPHDECAINEHVFILRANRRELQRYIFFWLDQHWMTQEIVSLNSNSAQPGINQPGVRSLPILLTPPRIVIAFDRIAAALTARLFRNCIESQTLAALRDTLLPKLMSGELSIAR